MLRPSGPYVASSSQPSRSCPSRWSHQQPLRTGQWWLPSSTPCSPSGTSTAATDPTLAGSIGWAAAGSTSTTWRGRLHQSESRTRSPAHYFALSCRVTSRRRSTCTARGRGPHFEDSSRTAGTRRSRTRLPAIAGRDQRRELRPSARPWDSAAGPECSRRGRFTPRTVAVCPLRSVN